MDIDEIQEKLKSELEGFKNDMANASNLDDIARIKTRYTGSKSYIITALGSIGSLPKEIRPAAGKEANRIKKEIESLLEEKEKYFKSIRFDTDLRNQKPDLSLTAIMTNPGRRHIISQVIEEIEELFYWTGF
jgi:phenylalanyl-tRNA synthetase alpha chain